WALADGGDEVLLLDPWNRRADGIAFGAGDFAALGLTGHDISVPAPNAIHHVDRLRGANLNDWVAFDLPTPGLPYLIPAAPAASLGPRFDELYTAWGLLYSHSTYSDGSGPPDLAFAVARANGLNFLALTDHSHAYTAAERARALAVAQSASAPGEFLALVGFEWSHDTGGHASVFGTTDDASATRPDGETLAAFYAWLAARPQALVTLNQPSDGDFDDFGHVPEVHTRFAALEVASGSGTEVRRFEEAYWRALRQGWQVGAVGNLDPVGTDWGASGPLRTGILLPTLTEETLFEAMRARRTFATEDANLALALRASEQWMGSEVEPGSLALTILVSDPDHESMRLELMEDGAIVNSADIVTSDGTFRWSTTVEGHAGDIYLVRAIQADGNHAWSSPIWVAGDDPPPDPPSDPGGSGDDPDDPGDGSGGDPGLDPALPVTAIGVVRGLPEDSHVTIEGIVTAAPGTFSQNTMYVQDATGGIKVYRHAGLDAFQPGDRVRLTGFIRAPYDEAEISVPQAESVERLGSGDPPAPRLIEHETIALHGGELVQVIGRVESWAGDYWYLDTGIERIAVYHDRDTGVRRPELTEGETRRVAGIVGWSDAGPRLMPRAPADLDPPAPGTPANDPDPPDVLPESGGE
ncbi:MAG: CehA/McbA family metallohydrolase, partial [Ardenticatenaceae bacterium]